MNLAGQVVLITGGSRGIGFATAGAFLAKGASVAICSRDEHSLQRAEKRLGRLGEVGAFRSDVKNSRQMERLVASVLRRFGKIDILVSNAGVLWMGEFSAQDVASMDEITDTNIKGVLYAARAVLPHMLERGSGIIVNISSGAGVSGIAELAVYCASKFAVRGFTESLAQEVEDRGILVYAVCPGAVATDMQLQVSGRKIGMPPEHIADKIVRLVSRPSIASGECLEVYR